MLKCVLCKSLSSHSKRRHSSINFGLSLAGGNSLLNEGIRDGSICTERHKIGSEWDTKLVSHFLDFLLTSFGLSICGAGCRGVSLDWCHCWLGNWHHCWSSSWFSLDVVAGKHFADNRGNRCSVTRLNCALRESTSCRNRQILLPSTSK